MNIDVVCMDIISDLEESLYFPDLNPAAHWMLTETHAPEGARYTSAQRNDVWMEK
ncbi:hypothetical protein LPH50_06915 [Xylella taiwanensis]|nr:hypothetical protein [Xylella taiwanensis]MCD8460230.1 hypothetical protein [Xylella taiwanensis]MCD8463712.1 hypothetical protein [Xylella taiwanensis]MCD8464732.1 hypothetical protein [Xylella taiwanensis]MCD8467709.1 hypothetical protein [Xylella taiwanensis]MCD8469957.1 hypothetical protein [Xylella taiwanensis]